MSSSVLDRKGMFFTVMVALWCNSVLQQARAGQGKVQGARTGHKVHTCSCLT